MQSSTTQGKTLAILQSSYIPWKGYFDIIRSVDEFVFLDCCQYTKRDWRNRNRIQTPTGPRWLTIPVRTKGRYTQTIEEAEIAEPWVERHLRTLESNYGRSRHFVTMAPYLWELYRSCEGVTHLSRINQRLISGICRLLGVRTRLTSSCVRPDLPKNQRLIEICRTAGATRYLSGPAAAGYLDPPDFAAAGIELIYMDYSGYPEYHQVFQPFEHHVSIIDLLFNAGDRAVNYMKTPPYGRTDLLDSHRNLLRV